MAVAIRVLYVDDEPDLLDISKLFLEESGDFNVTTALSAQEGIRLLEQKKFDAIVSDYQMPDMDGIQFLVEVRSRFGPIPFILFTGRGREEVVIQAINSGADFYLQKGGEPGAQFAELKHKIKAAASSKRADDELRKSEEKYRHLIEHSDEAIVVVQDGMLKLVNHRLIELLGYSEQELMSTPFPVFVHPDDCAMVVERYQKRMKGEEGPSRYAFRLSSKDGSIQWVELSVVVIDWDGRPATLNFLTDITERKRADDSLKEEQQFSKLMLDSLPGIFYLYTYPENRMVRWNKQHETLLGYTAEEIKGKLGTDLHLPEHKDAVLKAIDEVMEKGQSSVESTLLAKDGRLIPFFFTGVRFETPDQLYFMGNGIDITERKQAEEALRKNTEELHASYEQLTASEDELRQNVNDLSRTEQALRESEEKFHSLYLHMIEGAALHELTYNDQGIPEDYIIIETNPAFERQLGLSRDAIIGKTSREAYGLTEPPFLEIYARVALTGNPEIFETYFPPLAKHFSISAYSPGKGRFATIFEDITERKLAEKTLAESEEKFRSLAESSRDYIMRYDRQCRHTYMNPAGLRVSGLTEDQLIGKTHRESGYDETLSNLWEERITGVFETGKPFQTQFAWDSAEGHVVLDWLLTPEFSDDGMVRSVMGVSRDITQLKLAEKEQISAHERLKEAHRLAHIGTWDWVIETDTVIWSEELCNIAGWDLSKPAPTYAELPRVYTPSSWVLLSDAVTRALTTGEQYNLELEMVRPDGSIRWTNAFGGVLRDGNEKIIGLHGTVQDITESKQSKEANQKRDLQIRKLFENIPIGMFQVTPEGKFVFVNSAIASMLGYDSPEDLVETVNKTSVADALYEHLEKRPAFVREVQQNRGKWKIFENRYRKKDGKIIDTVLSFSLYTDPITGIENQYGFVQDITERKREEEALRINENRLQMTQEIGHIGSWEYDIKTNQMWGSKEGCHLFGYPRIAGSFPIENFASCITEPEKVLKAFNDLINEGKEYDLDFIINPKDGSAQKILHSIGRLEKDEQGNPVKVKGTNQDITERIQAEELLRESETRFHSMFERHDSVMLLIEPETGKIIDANLAAERFYGRTQKELCTQSINEINTLSPKEIATEMQNAVRENRNFFTFPHRLVSGEIRTVEVHSSPIEIEGKTILFSIVNDVTDKKRADLELVSVQQNLKEAHRLAHIGTFDWVIETDTVTWSEELCNIAGWDPSLPAPAFAEQSRFYTSASWDRLSSAIKRSLNTEEPFNIELEFVRPDGSTRWTNAFGGVKRDTKGDVIGFHGTVQDITERKQAEKNLVATFKRSQDQLAALKTISLSPLLFSGDVHGLSTILTEVSSGILGVERVSVWLFNNNEEELRCIDLYEVFYDRHSSNLVLKRHEYVNEFDALSTAKYIDAHDPLTDPRTAGYVEGYLKPNHITSMLDTVIRVYGQNLGVLCFEHVDRPHHWESDEIAFASQLADQIAITLLNRDRKLAEEAQAKSEERYRNVVEDQTEFICRFLPDGTHIFVNDAYCRYFDKKREEIIGQLFRPVLHPEDREPVARHLASLTMEHPVMDIDQRVIMPDGSIRWQRWSDRAIFDPNGRVIEYQSVGRDISEQKELEKEREYHEHELMKYSTSLATANKKLNLLSSVTRHDINNQLMVLMGYLTIMDKKQTDPTFNNYFGKVSTAAQRIANMIQFTKEYEKIGVHAPVWQDCRTLVDAAAKEAPLGKIVVKNDLPNGGEVFADPLIVKVFYNLMDNAVRYGGKITTIRFSADGHDAEHVIVSEDDGDGVVAEEKEKIFERGFGKNTGLGLALSLEILAITGITIRETGEPGKGARFEMAVPKGMWRMTGKGD